MMELNKYFKDYSLEDLQSPKILQKLDDDFLNLLKKESSQLYKDLTRYRSTDNDLSPIEKSEIIIATAKIFENPVVQKFTSDEGQDALAEKIGKRVGKEIENELKNSPAVKKVEKIADAVGGMLGVKKEEETVVPSGDGSISAQVASQQNDISSLPPQVVRTVAWNYIKSFWPLG